MNPERTVIRSAVRTCKIRCELVSQIDEYRRNTVWQMNASNVVLTVTMLTCCVVVDGSRLERRQAASAIASVVVVRWRPLKESGSEGRRRYADKQRTNIDNSARNETRSALAGHRPCKTRPSYCRFHSTALSSRSRIDVSSQLRITDR